MTLRRHLLGLSTFVLLSAVVVFNAFYLQGMRPKLARGDAAGPALALADQPLTTAKPVLPVEMSQSATTQTVAAIQRELDQRGYAPGAADGIASPVTRAGILAFEVDQGLPLTAEPGDGVLQALILGSGVGAEAQPAQAKQPGPEAEKLIRRVQRDLAALGYGPFQSAGRLTDDTARAISKFERDQNLQVTGRISAPLVARLLRLAPQEVRRNPG